MKIKVKKHFRNNTEGYEYWEYDHLNKKCTKCCFCGLDKGDRKLLLYHACTGEEEHAVQCPEMSTCFGMLVKKRTSEIKNDK